MDSLTVLAFIAVAVLLWTSFGWISSYGEHVSYTVTPLRALSNTVLGVFVVVVILNLLAVRA